jgi:manganese transport protein
MLGATVMPHNLYLHSALVQYRRKPNDVEHNRSEVRYAYVDSLLALNIAWLVNSAIVVMAAAVFFQRGLHVASIEEAHRTLIPILGPAAGFFFALALLASGLSSSTTGTLAGQVVMEGFLTLRIRPWARRLVTRLIVIIPVIIAIAVGSNPMSLLVFSQVVLSFQLPFAIIPLIQFTRRRDVMGPFANRPLTTVVAWVVAGIVITLNAYLLYITVAGFF